MRPLRVLLVIMLLAAPAATAGCLAGMDETIKLTPYVPLVTAEPGRTTQFAIHVESGSAFRSELDVRAEGVPRNWTVEPMASTVLVDGRNTTAFTVNVTPAEDAAYGLTTFRIHADRSATPVHVKVGELGPEAARAGVGAQVYTVGYWDNGTIFYTNMKEVRDGRIPWTHLSEDADADENMRPIKAYVGGDRSEDPPEPYNSSGYVHLIEGFDARLREGNGGMRANETLVVRIPPEDAYTRDGNEDHPLYGDALNFVIHVISVDVLEDDRLCVEAGDVCVNPEDPRPPEAPGVLAAS